MRKLNSFIEDSLNGIVIIDRIANKMNVRSMGLLNFRKWPPDWNPRNSPSRIIKRTGVSCPRNSTLPRLNVATSIGTNAYRIGSKSWAMPNTEIKLMKTGFNAYGIEFGSR